MNGFQLADFYSELSALLHILSTNSQNVSTANYTITKKIAFDRYLTIIICYAIITNVFISFSPHRRAGREGILLRFREFDDKMRVYEKSLDQVIPKGFYVVLRLDGRGFTKFTASMGFEKPFDAVFSECMKNTVKSIMSGSGLRTVYGYTQSDEISILLHKDDESYNRKVRKYNSIVASFTSIAFMQELIKAKKITLENAVTTCPIFDCRTIVLPDKEIVRDYFFWRREDSLRNSLNSYAYWTLRQNGFTKGKATSELLKKSVADKNELLFQYGINFNNVSSWQKEGVALAFEEYTKTDTVTGTSAKRKRIVESVPERKNEDYGAFLAQLAGL